MYKFKFKFCNIFLARPRLAVQEAIYPCEDLHMTSTVGGGQVGPTKAVRIRDKVA